MAFLSLKKKQITTGTNVCVLCKKTPTVSSTLRSENSTHTETEYEGNDQMKWNEKYATINHKMVGKS